MFSQRVLVALDTGEGTVYAVASGWDRVCVLWMFRNFRSLPQSVLSPRQQQLIGSLYREVSHHRPHEFDGATLVGTVQHFKPSSLARRTPSAKATRPVPGVSVLKRKPFYAHFTFDRMTLKVGTAALVAAIAVLAWHQLGAQPIAASRSTEPVMTSKEVLANNLEPVIVQPPPNPAAALTSAVPIARTQPTTAPADRTFATAEITARRADTSVVSGHPQPNDASATTRPTTTRLATTRPATARIATAHSAVADLPGVYEAAADQPRMQISGRPRKLVYPVCPTTQARGKVSLQAEVGYDGEVNRVRVLTGARALAAAAVEAVRQWRYEPFSGAAPRLERETNITISFISNEVVAVSFPSSAPLSR